jgi:DNA-binding GntR family transcriptional regulator
LNPSVAAAKKMRTKSANEATGGRVYQTIKERVISYEFAPGRRIYIEPIAKELGVSTTPVREALNRLVAEDLVIKAPRKGYIAMTLSEDNLVGHYELARQLLSAELGKLEPSTRHKLSDNKSIAGVLKKLNRHASVDSDTLATYTGDIFVQIASVHENRLAVHAINRANDHLYYIRTIECQILEHVQSELTSFCELLLAAQCEELISAIHAYHDKRISLLHTLLDFLRR